MYCKMRTRAAIYPGIHLIIAVICFTLGVIISDKDEEIDYDNNVGIYAMGVWLGVWMVLKSLCGILVMIAPVTWRISCYIGLCCITMVTYLICCIPLITGPIMHYLFELKATKEYYRIHGPESIYHKPKSYFDKRNKIGSKGCGMYGAILTLIVLDTVMTALSCHVWKTILNKLKAQERATRQHAPAVSANTNNNYQSSTPQLVILPEIHNGFASNNEFPKLPSYIDLYPEGSDPTLENQSNNLPHETPEQPSASHDPESDSPPAYNEICNTPNTPAIDNPPDYEQTLQNDTSSFETP